MPYNTFDHEADTGLEVEAETLEGLIEEACRALSALVAGARVRATRSVDVSISGSEPDVLLHDALSELLYRLDAEGFVPASCTAQLDHGTLRLRVGGETYNPSRHGGGTAVKGVTWHGLSVEHKNGGWKARIILDI